MLTINNCMLQYLAWRVMTVGSLKAIAQVVNDSAQCNSAQLVSAEDGTIVVPSFNWTSFGGSSQYHHFRFAATHPGVVFARKQSDTAEVKVDLLKDSWTPDPSEYPPQQNGNGTRFGSFAQGVSKM